MTTPPDSSWVTPDNIAAGIAGLGATFLALLGYSRGRSKPETSNVEIAGALIDSSKAQDVIDALDRNTAALVQNTEMKRRHLEELQANTSEVRDLASEIKFTNRINQMGLKA